MAIRAVFIDRDGTLSDQYHIATPQEFVALPGIVEDIARLRASGIAAYLFTNQSCIARGLDGGYDFPAAFAALGVDGYYLCPHDQHDNCDCRKPAPGLLRRALAEHTLCADECAVIGDRWSDMAAGGSMGMHLVLVRTGRGNEALTQDRGKWGDYSPDLVEENFHAAVEAILQLNLSAAWGI